MQGGDDVCGHLCGFFDTVVSLKHMDVSINDDLLYILSNFEVSWWASLVWNVADQGNRREWGEIQQSKECHPKREDLGYFQQEQ